MATRVEPCCFGLISVDMEDCTRFLCNNFRFLLQHSNYRLTEWDGWASPSINAQGFTRGGRVGQFFYYSISFMSCRKFFSLLFRGGAAIPSSRPARKFASGEAASENSSAHQSPRGFGARTLPPVLREFSLVLLSLFLY